MLKTYSNKKKWIGTLQVLQILRIAPGSIKKMYHTSSIIFMVPASRNVGQAAGHGRRLATGSQVLGSNNTSYRPTQIYQTPGPYKLTSPAKQSNLSSKTMIPNYSNQWQKSSLIQQKKDRMYTEQYLKEHVLKNSAMPDPEMNIKSPQNDQTTSSGTEKKRVFTAELRQDLATTIHQKVLDQYVAATGKPPASMQLTCQISAEIDTVKDSMKVTNQTVDESEPSKIKLPSVKTVVITVGTTLAGLAYTWGTNYFQPAVNDKVNEHAVPLAKKGWNLVKGSPTANIQNQKLPETSDSSKIDPFDSGGPD